IRSDSSLRRRAWHPGAPGRLALYFQAGKNKPREIVTPNHKAAWSGEPANVTANRAQSAADKWNSPPKLSAKQPKAKPNSSASMDRLGASFNPMTRKIPTVSSSATANIQEIRFFGRSMGVSGCPPLNRNHQTTASIEASPGIQRAMNGQRVCTPLQ